MTDTTSIMYKLNGIPLKHFIELSTVPTFIMDESLAVIFANESWHTILGFPKNSDSINTWLSFVDEESSLKIVNNIAELLYTQNSTADNVPIHSIRFEVQFNKYLSSQPGVMSESTGRGGGTGRGGASSMAAKPTCLFIAEVVELSTLTNPQSKTIISDVATINTDELNTTVQVPSPKIVICLLVDVTDVKNEMALRFRNIDEQLTKSKRKERQQDLYIQLVSFYTRQPPVDQLTTANKLSIVKKSVEDLMYVLKETTSGSPIPTVSDDHIVIEDLDHFSRMDTSSIRLNKTPLPLRKTLDSILQSVIKLVNRNVSIDDQVWVLTDIVRLRALIAFIIKLADLCIDKDSTTTTSRENYDSSTQLLSYGVTYTGRKLEHNQIAFINNRIDLESTITIPFDNESNIVLFLIKSIVETFDGNLYYTAEPLSGLTNASASASSSATGKGSGTGTGAGDGATGLHVCSIDINLPIAETRDRPASMNNLKDVSSSTKRPAFNRHVNVLVVEDDTLTLKIQQKLIAQFGHSVKIASNGSTALDLVNENNFDIIFVDVEMPIMDGLELTRRIRNLEKYQGSKAVPIVVITGHKDKDYENKALSVGATVYTTKPISVPGIYQGFIEKYVGGMN